MTPVVAAVPPSEPTTAPAGDVSLLLIRKARDVLHCFLPDNAGLTLAHVHRLTGLPSSTALRILRSLVAEDFLVHDGVRYRLSKGMMRWAAAVGDDNLDLRRAAAPHLAELSSLTGNVSLLYVEDGASAVCVAAAANGAKLNQPVGETLPLFHSPVGKALLAPHADGVRRFMRGRFGSVANLDHRADTMRRVSAEFASIAKSGYLVQACGELGTDLWSCSPVHGNTGVTVAVVAVRQTVSERPPNAELLEMARRTRAAADGVSLDSLDLIDTPA